MLARPCSLYHCERRCSQSRKCLTSRRPAFCREIFWSGYLNRSYHIQPDCRFENVHGQDIICSRSAQPDQYSPPSFYQVPHQIPGTRTRYFLRPPAISYMGRISLRRGFSTSYLYSSAIRSRSFTSFPTTKLEIHHVHQMDQDTNGGRAVPVTDTRFSAGAEITPILPTEKLSLRSQLRRTTKERLELPTPSFPASCTPLRPTISETVNETISSTARNTRRYLNRRQHSHEFAVRSKCLYVKTLIHPNWNENFGLVFSHQVRGENMTTVWDKLKLEHEEEALNWLTGVDWTAEDPAHLSRHWSRLRRHQKEKLWPPIALWLLLNSPRAALAFLLATDITPAPPFSMVAKCFLYLDAFHYEELTQDERSKQYYEEAFNTCLNPNKWPVLKTYERGIRLFLKRATSQDVNNALSTILDHGIYVGFETATYLMDLFTKQHDIPRALDSLRLVRATFDYHRFLSDPRVLYRCCKLLTLDYVIEKKGERYFRILPEILKIGVPLNQPMLNIIYRNALKQNVPTSVPHVLHEMGKKGIPPDSYTYISLLDDALSRRDLQHLDVIIREISSQDSLRTNPFITSKMLHVVYSLDRVNPDEGWGDTDVFDRMLNIYNAAHDIQPLVDLGILRVDKFALENREKSGKPLPSSHSLVIMIAAFLRMQDARQIVDNVFDRFLYLCDQGHESFGPLAESDYIYNVFLQEFSRRRSGRLRNCVRVLDKMLQPLPPTAILRSQNNRQLEQAKPTVRTWTILLTAFLSDRRPNAVEKVRSMMQEQGLKFNEVTWNVAVSGFARMQMVDATADAVNTMMTEGWALDEYTLNSMQWIHDRHRLLALMDNVDAKIDDRTRRRSTESEEYDEPSAGGVHDDPVEKH
ncbi:hypothetical protein AJ78_03511 [Emergomyces pasteurianus Ep9510]|uniref:Pentatricopeptide repeat domain-containing protein n=1 Tax=Emergomyces pasteurianus Ep9510 TaxID=1447872 RepID=A0A1J9Q7T2_9EURO|nr:hypothetical protein AJ78_03511 [Emergomyces pasteurianus Ep9510]